MKITKSKLKQIIKEELEKVVQQEGVPETVDGADTTGAAGVWDWSQQPLEAALHVINRAVNKPRDGAVLKQHKNGDIYLETKDGKFLAGPRPPRSRMVYDDDIGP